MTSQWVGEGVPKSRRKKQNRLIWDGAGGGGKKSTILRSPVTYKDNFPPKIGIQKEISLDTYFWWEFAFVIYT